MPYRCVKALAIRSAIRPVIILQNCLRASENLRERYNLNVSSRERYTRAIDGLYGKRFGDSVILETRVKHFDHVVVAYADVQFELLHVARMDYEIFHTKASQ